MRVMCLYVHYDLYITINCCFFLNQTMAEKSKNQLLFLKEKVHVVVVYTRTYMVK